MRKRTFDLLILMAVWLVATAASAQTASESAIETGDLSQITLLDLDTACRLALVANPSLAAARARVAQAEQRLLQTRSQYWPRLDANAAGNRVWLSDRSYEQQLLQARLFDPNAQIDDPDNIFDAGLYATWVAFDGFARKFRVAQAQFGLVRSQAGSREARRLILAAVARAYYSALLAQESIAIAEADDRFNRRQLEDAQARYQVGVGPLSDTLNFKVRVNSAQSFLIEARRAWETSLYTLAAVLGLENVKLSPALRLTPLASETAADMAIPDTALAVALAAENRPDVAQAQWAVQQSKAAVKVAQAGYYPSVNLMAGVNGSRQEDPSFESEEFGSAIGLELNYNLFAGGLDRARVGEARAARREIESELDRLQIRVSADVRTAIARVIEAQKQVRLQTENAALVTQNRDLVALEFKSGEGTLVRLNEAQRDLNTARGRLAQARVALRQAWFDLKVETGEILSDYAQL